MFACTHERLNLLGATIIPGHSVTLEQTYILGNFAAAAFFPGDENSWTEVGTGHMPTYQVVPRWNADLTNRRLQTTSWKWFSLGCLSHHRLDMAIHSAIYASYPPYDSDHTHRSLIDCTTQM